MLAFLFIGLDYPQNIDTPHPHTKQTMTAGVLSPNKSMIPKKRDSHLCQFQLETLWNILNSPA